MEDDACASPSSAPTIPGALVEALTEFSSRDVNLTRIESRPLRQGLGRYMFFVDLEGADAEPPVAEAIEALRDEGRERARARQLPGPSHGGIPGALTGPASGALYNPAHHGGPR